MTKKTQEPGKQDDATVLTRTLAAARTETTRRAALVAAARLGLFIGITSVFATLFDRYFKDHWTSLAVWTLWRAAVVGRGFFETRRFLRNLPTTVQAARRLERRFTDLEGILTAAIEFAEETATLDAASAELRDATIRTAARKTPTSLRELDADERFAVLWNVDAKKTRFRTIFDGGTAVFCAALAVGIATSGSAKIETKPENGEQNAEVVVENRHETSSPASAVEKVENAQKTPPEIAPGQARTAVESAAFAADLTRLIGVSLSFVDDLRRRAASDRAGERSEISDIALLQGAREIESLVVAPRKGLRDRAARLERAATQDAPVKEKAPNGENGNFATSRQFVAAATAIRAREFRETLVDESVFGATARLGAAFRGAESTEILNALDETARRQECFVETLRREKSAWLALAASWEFDGRRRAFQAGIDALFVAGRAELAQNPGRSAFESAGENVKIGKTARAATSLQSVVSEAVGDFERIRETLARPDSAEFLAFAERIVRRVDSGETENGNDGKNGSDVVDVGGAVLEWSAAKAADCDEIAENAKLGRFGAALERVEQLTFGTLSVDSTSAAESADRVATTAARLTFGFGGSENGGENGSETAEKTPNFANETTKTANVPPNGDDISALDGDLNDNLAKNADATPTGFDDLRELAARFNAELDGNATQTARKNGEFVGGNAPDATFSGGSPKRDAKTPSTILGIDARWNELPDVEKERLRATLKTETPPEFHEKIRLYRRRIFNEF